MFHPSRTARAEVDYFQDEKLFPEFHTSLDDLPDYIRNKYEFPLKSREQHLKDLKDPSTELDLLIIGGGCNGAAVALEASSRGLKCAVVDAYDFASGTSSRSTKLAHGGIRYLEQIFKREGNPSESYELLKEALNERNYFLMSAPFMNKPVKIIIPSNNALVSYFYHFPGAFLYHTIYVWKLLTSTIDPGDGVPGSSIMTNRTLRKTFPDLKSLHSMSASCFHEVSMRDSRQNILTLLTAAVDSYNRGHKGALLANYVEVKQLTKDEKGNLNGAVLHDK